jgi:hypothetical protein
MLVASIGNDALVKRLAGYAPVPGVRGDRRRPHRGARREPPGFMLFNYGRSTMAITVVLQLVFGAIVGAFAAGR